MQARRCRAFAAGINHFQKMPSIWMTRPRLGLHGLPSQRVRDIERPVRSVGNPIAAMAEMEIASRSIMDEPVTMPEEAWPRSVSILNRQTSRNA